MAVYLSYLDNPDGQRILFVTFNKALVTYLNYMSDGLLKNVDVRNYHRFAWGYLKYNVLIGRNDVVPTKKKKIRLLNDAIAGVINETGTNTTLKRVPEVFYEEINWIERMAITTLYEYVEAARFAR